jgi:pimeloyl-ACP methyl ester carboxylesterase
MDFLKCFCYHSAMAAIQLNTVTIDSLDIFFRSTEGTGIPVVFVHGNSLSSRSFLHQLQSDLGKQYRLLALDLPGHGMSSASNNPQKDYSLDGLASLLLRFAERTQAEGGFFVGWSLGGHILLEAAQSLDTAGGFVIFGTPPLDYPPDVSEAFMDHPASALMFKPEQNDEERETVLQALFREEAPSIPASFREDLASADPVMREMLGRQISEGGYKDEKKIVATLSTPLAVLHGTEEQLVKRPYFDKLSFRNLWRKTVVEIPSAGHAPQWEQPDLFNDLLKKFIEEQRR